MSLDLFFYKERKDILGNLRTVNFLIAFFESSGYEIQNLSPIEISKEDIEELLDRCNKVLSDNSLAEELLPAQKGYFFRKVGYYDKCYFEDIEYIKNFIEDILLPEFDKLNLKECIKFGIWY